MMSTQACCHPSRAASAPILPATFPRSRRPARCPWSGPPRLAGARVRGCVGEGSEHKPGQVQGRGAWAGLRDGVRLFRTVALSGSGGE